LAEWIGLRHLKVFPGAMKIASLLTVQQTV
jgi:hypothetical protein